MSWFYEALVRAEGRPPEKDAATVETIGQNGDSFLNEIESLSAPSMEVPNWLESSLAAKQVALEELPAPKTSPSRGPETYRRYSTVLRPESRVIFHTEPLSLAAEQFRLLRRSLVQAFPRGGALMVTSPGAGDGKSLTAVNLCAALADSGDATLLVEVDLRRPSMHRVLGCNVEPTGIEDVLRGRTNTETAIRFVEELGFYVAMVSDIPRNPSYLLAGSACKEMIAWARQHFRWVVLDTAPVMPNADVAELLPAIDAALLVVRAQITPKELTRRAFDVLGKRLHGVVLNEATLSSTPYYRYLSDYSHPVQSKAV